MHSCRKGSFHCYTFEDILLLDFHYRLFTNASEENKLMSGCPVISHDIEAMVEVTSCPFCGYKKEKP